ncbi:MAG TPA: tetratricopeptide repeat protein [Streptosporangiaceae bacterium]|nr:tetratricopeptide repeat protein [Streptosporangiaceae bacterium]
MSEHLWLVSPRSVSQEIADVEVDCHRLLRGPYTGTSALLRTLVPRVSAREPALAREHALEILVVAPDLETFTGPVPDTLTTLASGLERTRIYAVGRTRQVTHGIIDFLRSCANGPAGPLTLSFRNVDEADHTDQEFLAILLRRAASLITLHIGTHSDHVTDELLAALHTHARKLNQVAPSFPVTPRSHQELLHAYIESDGTSDDPAEIAAYEDDPPAHRAALHDTRAEVLRGLDEPGSVLGAIPYHLEHGSDPAGAGVRALLHAGGVAQINGFYHATLENGMRGRAIIDPAAQPEVFWHLTGMTANAQALLGNAEQAESLYLEVRRTLSLPEAQLANSYALAMVYTRYHVDGRKDHAMAKAYLNTALAIASLWPDPAERAFYTVFNENALALVEMHSGNGERALKLVTEGGERLDRELPHGTHKLHRSVLVANRASLLARFGRLEEARQAFDEVIAADPNYGDYYFERADVRRRLGDSEGASADYAAALALAPPIWELHYNRADLRTDTGDLEGAITDLTRALDLEPAELDVRVNLSSLLLDTGDLASARAVVDDGLLIHPGQPSLLCVRAQANLEAGAPDQARADLNLALAADPHHVGSLAARAAIGYAAGDYAAAVNDLTQAIESAGDDPDLLYNRARTYQAAHRWDAAIADYERALGLPGADIEELLAQQKECRADRAAADHAEAAVTP